MRILRDEHRCCSSRWRRRRRRTGWPSATGASASPPPRCSTWHCGRPPASRRRESPGCCTPTSSGPALPVALFGAAAAGVPFVPLNYRLADDRLRGLVGPPGPRPAALRRRAPSTGQPASPASSRSPPRASSPRCGGVEPATAHGSQDADAVAVLLHTSGTSGEPKVAVLRHRHLAGYVLGSVDFLGAGDDEASLVSVPPYHIAAVSALLTSVYGGRRIVQLPDFDPAAWVDVAIEQRITHAMTVPTMLARILDAVESPDGPTAGGGRRPPPPAPPVLRRWADAATRDRAGDGADPRGRLRQRLRPDRDELVDRGAEPRRAPRAYASDDPLVRRRLSSVGRPLPTVEITVRDPDGRELLPERAGRDLGAGRAGVGRVRPRGTAAPPTAGSPPATAVGSTPTATCTSRDASTT